MRVYIFLFLFILIYSIHSPAFPIMKFKFPVIALLLSIAALSKAQTVTIPDANFVSYLQTNYPGCMSGNQMDTSCAAIRNAQYMDVYNQSISDLTGLEYFINLKGLNCGFNSLSSLPALPDHLQSLECNYNLLTYLPPLPNTLCSLHCNNNLLTVLPALPPNSIDDYGFGFSLQCGNNQLTGLPALPQRLYYLFCENNNISCFPTLPAGAYYNLGSNPFTCLPNYAPGMGSALLAYPLCVPGDTVNNPNNCERAEGIEGYAYKDDNNNCIMDVNEVGINNISFKMYDSVNNLLGSTSSFSNGIYQFIQFPGTYRVELDTLGMPFTAQCVYPGIDSLITLTDTNSLAENVNFGLTCKPGFDLGVQAIYYSGRVFPGQNHVLYVFAGDMGQWYNLNCAAGVGGQIQITVSGPVTYVGVPAGALVPAVAGNVFTYSVADFGTVNSGSFCLVLNTNITAQVADQVCVDVTSSAVGDNNSLNNTKTLCYAVVNSFDPNMKEVYPVNVAPGYQDWLTYTIHFQNTGNAPAMNIKLADTLDAALDLSTFQVTNYSHFNTSSLVNNALAFNFPNIQLPDSLSDPEGSKGFVQYRIKPRAGRPAGTTIHNTAYIYFDYNAAVVTNTTVNEFVLSLSINENNANTSFTIFPNPGNGKYMVSITGNNASVCSLEVYNALGEIVLTEKKALNVFQIDLSSQPDGIYFVKLAGANQPLYQRIIKQ